MRGGAGVDSFDGGAGNDRVSFFALTATQGAVASLITQTISNDGYGNAETMISVEGLGGGTAYVDTFIGDDNANILLGGIGDTLLGNGGDDHFQMEGAALLLDGGAGIDSVSFIQQEFGALFVDNNGDGFAETVFATSGVNVDLHNDIINNDGFGNSGVIQNVENIEGSILADTITGSDVGNVLDGGAGADTMIGGLGDDTYVVDNVGDVVTENASEGTDTVQASITYALTSDVENLTLTGAAAINGTGNTLANTLIGNSAANTLDGGAGADTMAGGLGDDTYFVDNGGDVVTENVGEGTDTINSTRGDRRARGQCRKPGAAGHGRHRQRQCSQQHHHRQCLEQLDQWRRRRRHHDRGLGQRHLLRRQCGRRGHRALGSGNRYDLLHHLADACRERGEFDA